MQALGESFLSFHTKYKHYKFDGKFILVTGTQGVPQNHTIQQTSHKRFVRREKNRRVAASVQARNSRELNRRQDLYRISWGGGRAFQGEAFEGGDWGDFKFRAWDLYSIGQEQGQTI